MSEDGLAKQSEQLHLGIPGTLTETDWQPPEDLDYADWQTLLTKLCTMQDAIQWWIGDAIAFGERKYGEMYERALEETDYSYESLRQMVRVSNKVQLCNRLHNLSWSHHHAVAALSAEEQAVWLGKAVDGNWSVRELQQKLRGNAHIAEATGVSEWYTPGEYIQAARSVMGSIDLDPASCAIANEEIQAEEYYGVEDDGLAQDWHGRVWLNPPYAQPAVRQFAEKLVEERRHSRVARACVLVNNATDTEWFQILVDITSAICFPKGRVNFWGPDGEEAHPLQGQAVLYIGDNTDRFAQAFSAFGFVVRL